jgi:mevalonate kinase
MEDITNKIYPGKALLFGEYTVIHGGDSLAIPLYKKTANWDYDDLEFESRESLDRFVDFLVVQGIGKLDLEKFSNEWNDGLFLDSNIPKGYGAGSSGSIVASVYDAFMSKVPDDSKELRELFIKMENFFHGSSSGIDPLVSYFGKPVYLNNGSINLIEADSDLSRNLYLWDSGVSRTTAPLVEWYKNSYNEFLKPIVDEKLIPINQKLIASYLNEDRNSFRQNFAVLEKNQLKYLIPMFPSEIKNSLLSFKETYNLMFKLCGAGGGGFYLLYSEDNEIQNESGIIPLQ